MADDLTEKQLQEIEKTTRNLAGELSKVREAIGKSTKETNAWFDATKAVQSATEGENKAREKLRNIGQQILKNREKEKELTTDNTKLASRSAQISIESGMLRQRIARETAIINDATAAASDKQAAARRREDMIDSRRRLVQEKIQNREKISGNNEVMAKLKSQDAILKAQGRSATQLIIQESARKEEAELLKGVYDNLFQPLIGDSKEFQKLASLGNALLKGGAESYLAIIKASIDRWKELDQAALDFRKNTGFLVTQTRELNKAAREVNVQMQNLGIGIKEAYEAATALTNEFQVIGLVTKEAIANTAMMAANLGLNVQDAAKFKGLFESISNSVGSTGDSMIKSAAALAEMGGVAPRAVLKDMAEASEDTLAFLAKSPMALMRATVEARRLGTTVNSISKSARGLLNYQDSITSELEASALIGKALNFQEARAAAYAGDVVKSRELALKQIEKAGDFTRLNVYQQEALAKAAGMTTAEIIKQQNQQKLLAKLEQTRPELYKKYMAMQQKIKENEKAAAADLEKQSEEMAKRELMQGEMNKLTNAFAAIWTDIADALLAIANTIMPPIIIAARLLGFTFKIIAAVVRGFLAPFDKFVSGLRSGEEGGLKLEEIMTKIGEGVTKIVPYAEKLGEAVSTVVRLFMFLGIMSGKVFTELKSFQAVSAIFLGMGLYIKDIFVGLSRVSGIGARLSNMFSWVSPLITQISKFTNLGAVAVSKLFGAVGGIGNALGPVAKLFGVFGKTFGLVGKFVGIFAKAIPGIGQVITAIQILWELGTSLFSIWTDDNLSIGDKIIQSFLAVPGAIFDAIIAPFIDIGVWVLRQFGVDIPDDMVEGIKSVGKEILQWTLMPFVKVWEWLKNTFMGESPSELGLGILDGIKSIGGMLLDALITPFKEGLAAISKLFAVDGPVISCIRNIIKGIKTIMRDVFDLIVSPFKSAFNFIKKIPFVGRLLGGDATSAMNGEVKASVEKQVTMAVEVKNLDELKQTINKLVEAISSLGGTAGGASPVVNVNNNQNAMLEKLDELIELLKDGAIAVNMDGASVSRTLAKVS